MPYLQSLSYPAAYCQRYRSGLRFLTQVGIIFTHHACMWIGVQFAPVVSGLGGNPTHLLQSRKWVDVLIDELSAIAAIRMGRRIGGATTGLRRACFHWSGGMQSRRRSTVAGLRNPMSEYQNKIAGPKFRIFIGLFA